LEEPVSQGKQIDLWMMIVHNALRGYLPVIGSAAAPVPATAGASPI